MCQEEGKIPHLQSCILAEVVYFFSILVAIDMFYFLISEQVRAFEVSKTKSRSSSLIGTNYQF